MEVSSGASCGWRKFRCCSEEGWGEYTIAESFGEGGEREMVDHGICRDYGILSSKLVDIWAGRSYIYQGLAAWEVLTWRWELSPSAYSRWSVSLVSRDP